MTTMNRDEMRARLLALRERETVTVKAAFNVGAVPGAAWFDPPNMPVADVEVTEKAKAREVLTDMKKLGEATGTGVVGEMFQCLTRENYRQLAEVRCQRIVERLRQQGKAVDIADLGTHKPTGKF